jgi:hypothetical protein
VYAYPHLHRHLEHRAPGVYASAGHGHLAAHDQQRPDIAKFKPSLYEDLPIAEYAECVTFIKQAYTSITGADLDLPEQQTLDLE